MEGIRKREHAAVAQVAFDMLGVIGKRERRRRGGGGMQRTIRGCSSGSLIFFASVPHFYSRSFHSLSGFVRDRIAFCVLGNWKERGGLENAEKVQGLQQR